MKTYHFISGLPRSGSTLLANILSQNPRFYASATSGIIEVMFGVRNTWDTLVEFRAHPEPAGKKRVLKGIFESYYSAYDKPVIFDKSRGWLALIEMLEHVLEIKAKILVPVRDVRDVMASFEKLWRTTSVDQQTEAEHLKYVEFQNIESRTKVWLQPDQPVGLAYNRLRDAIQRGYRDRMHFVKFEELTSNPKKTMEEVYKFLGEEWFPHDFDNVAQVTKEDDAVYGFKGLHDIRPKVEPIKSQWPAVLGMWAEPYSKFNIWDNPN